MTSLDLVRQLHQRGLLTKEAALDLLRRRERLIKQALFSESRKLWDAFFSLAKEASLFDSLGRPAKTVARGGFFSQLRKGGLTPSKEPAASWSDVGSNLLKMIGIAGLSAGATAGAGALWKHRRDRQLHEDVETSYKKMFEEFPRLGEIDPDRVRTHFEVLRKFAPSLAAVPTVAGTFLMQTLNSDLLSPMTIRTLAETQHRIDEMHEGRSPLTSHFDRGLQMAHKAMNPPGGSKPA